MTGQTAPSNPTSAVAHDSTLVVTLELSGKSWEVGTVLPANTRPATAMTWKRASTSTTHLS